MELMFEPIRKYADFNGRARRQEYWMFQLFLWGSLIGVSIISMTISAAFMDPAVMADGAAGATPQDVSPTNSVATIVNLVISLGLGLFFLAMIIPNLAVRVRRLHDIGVSGWLVLIAIIPFIGGLVLFIMAIIDGHVGKNEFGPDPKGRGEPQVADTFS